MNRIKSQMIYKKACEVIPGGVNSPVRAFKGLAITPMIVNKGEGAWIEDVDGRRYIDYCMSWGASVLGHAHPEIIETVSAQLQKGSSFGIATEIEEKMASKIVDMMPSIEKIRFVSSGTEATMTAIRLARGYTGREKILKFTGHYHGHTDALLVKPGSGASSLTFSKGVPSGAMQDTLCFEFNDVDGLKHFFNSPLALQTAGLILEPVTGNMGVILPKPGFLDFLRKETARLGIVLIFDEVMTGFRVGLHGAQGVYQINPDLTCLGKIVGGGFPAAALGGKKEILDLLSPLGDVYQAGTLSGNPVAMEAGFKTLSILERPGVFSQLLKNTDSLTQPLQHLFSSVESSIVQAGAMFSPFLKLNNPTCRKDLDHLDEACFQRFFIYLFERGIYIPPHPHESWFLSSAHTKDQIDYTMDCIHSFISSELEKGLLQETTSSRLISN